MEFLIKKAIKGDSEAFIRLIDKYETSMYKTAKAILNNEEAYEEVIDDKLEFDECFEKLSREYKLVLNLYYVEGFNSREISEILNENENTIKSRLLRGKKQLKNFLINNEEGDLEYVQG